MVHRQQVLKKKSKRIKNQNVFVCLDSSLSKFSEETLTLSLRYKEKSAASFTGFRGRHLRLDTRVLLLRQTWAP